MSDSHSVRLLDLPADYLRQVRPGDLETEPGPLGEPVTVVSVPACEWCGCPIMGPVLYGALGASCREDWQWSPGCDCP